MVPSIVLLVMWALFSSYTVFDGLYLRLVASGVRDASIPAVKSFAALQKERELSMTSLSQPGSGTAALLKQRQATDESLATMKTAFGVLAAQAPPEIVSGINSLNGLLDQLSRHRALLESGEKARAEIYNYYNSVLDSGAALFNTQARIVPDVETVQGALAAVQYFQAADSMSRAGSVAAGAVAAGKFTPETHREFVTLVGAYRSSLNSIEPYALPDVREHYKRLTSGQAWQQLAELENRLVQNAERPIRDTVRLADWQQAGDSVNAELIELVDEQSTGAVNVALGNGEDKLTTVLIGSVVALIAVLIGIAVAVRISRRLVNKALITRLARLRSDSLQLAHERLPDIVGRLREGKHVDVAAEVPALDYGNDEIGQVADAFNAAQYTAVAAAVKESQAREGVNRVFLDIAHRNQGLVHRQLKILDKLQHEEENPDQLDAFFQLDHLATRARRNAENLIILAGEQPGRRWRKPVRMLDVVRAGVAETEQYARVLVKPMPEMALAGAAVADTIHLIAELVDNATSFSPPRSQVQVHCSEVPQGVVVEIEDHGLGIKPEDREQHNKMLASPPDFEAMRLRGESRLGLFVVARLAARRGIRVELRDCSYGGTIALVLIPSDLIVGDATAIDGAETAQMHQNSFRTNHQQQSGFPNQEGFVLEARPADSSFPARDSMSGVVEQDDRPQLPRRRRQEHLAPQLANDDFHSVHDMAVHDSDQQAERSRSGLSAFQQGTHDARRAPDALEP
ncbi:nitrate- and nitrite sensing domain-containing protein [Lentzea sp. NPDC051213]|uniref:sensor histidine kinase n=1 Tax=Lentzea sp. NPDC051213 TaxID=3364126 RepID=UPI00378E5AD7